MKPTSLETPARTAPLSDQHWPLPSAVAQFAVANATAYQHHYENLLSRRTTSGRGQPSTRLPLAPSWHWTAFLLTVPWMFYRKMYSGGIILVALPVLLDHILPGSLFLGSGLLIALTAGIWGKTWYVEHAIRRIEKAGRIHPEGPARAAYLERARGVSLAAGIFGALIQIVTATVIVMDLAPPSRF